MNQKPTGTASSIPRGLASGAAASIMITVLGALLAAKLIDHQVLLWDHCGYAVLMILILASWTGAGVTVRKVKRQHAMMCLASGGIYFCLLLASTALFFGGQYSGVGETALLIFCGSTLGILGGFGRKKGRKGRKIRVRPR